MTPEQIKAERERFRKAKELEDIANNERMAPVFRQRAEQRLQEMGVASQTSPTTVDWSAVFDDVEYD